MPRKLRELKEDLKRAGFAELKGRGKGSHSLWAHPSLPDTTVVLAGSDGDDAKRYQERDVKRAIAHLEAAK